eukprot:scaffold21808_cov123-Isochrysis_galbana.AAC.1
MVSELRALQQPGIIKKLRRAWRVHDGDTVVGAAMRQRRGWASRCDGLGDWRSLSGLLVWLHRSRLQYVGSEERAGGFGLRASASPPPTSAATPAGAGDRGAWSGSSDGAALTAERPLCDSRATAVERVPPPFLVLRAVCSKGLSRRAYMAGLLAA